MAEQYDAAEFVHDLDMIADGLGLNSQRMAELCEAAAIVYRDRNAHEVV